MQDQLQGILVLHSTYWSQACELDDNNINDKVFCLPVECRPRGDDRMYPLIFRNLR